MRIHMGVAYLPDTSLYWSDMYNMPTISSIMSRNRYDHLTHMLYFSNTHTDNRLHKINILLDALQTSLTRTCIHVYTHMYIHQKAHQCTTDLHAYMYTWKSNDT